ncbi:MAG: NAD-dependent epimerase/dehydratase family protein [Anaerolineales bacterium]|nr:NAD-dependent epimerase/dehydratase family protein [Anaerolineales bacterium]
MRKKVILITGASGEIGHSLITALSEKGEMDILSLDIRPISETLSKKVTHINGSILDKNLLDRIVSEYEIDTIYHLAALLSTRAEFTPDAAHRVNVEGTLTLLEMARQQSGWRAKPVKFIFPSSIAAYGMPDQDTKTKYARVREWEWNYPVTMYGCNKLYCEFLGTYYSKHYMQLAEEQSTRLDFRSVRFPGLISAFTLPTGGTTDYVPEMLHAAAQKKSYACFVSEPSILPFMAMPDAVKALLHIAAAPREKLNHSVYNVTSFSLSAQGFKDRILSYFPDAEITFDPDIKRQAIVDTWPNDMDDSAAQKDWVWEPDYGLEKCFSEYLVPNVTKRYRD